MTFFKELKQRSVIKVAIAYAIAAWLLIQIIDTTFPILKLPEWSVPLVTVFILIGFPLALIFAWAFELTPEGIKLEKDVERSASVRHLTNRKLDFVIIAILAIAVAYFLFDKSSDELSAEPDKWQSSIAVLPFANMSGNPDNEYFSDGVSEEILNLLATIPDLKVIGRTSSFSFKGKNEDLRVIGQRLDVKFLLEGSVRKSGDRVRITAQLVDVSDGSRIWSETYDRMLTDIFEVQDDVAAAIIDALQIHIGATPSRGQPTDNSEAYALFLRARVLLDAQQGGEAIELLQQAIELDSSFAEAMELLAFGYWQQASTSFPAARAQELCYETAARALSIDSDLTFARAMYELASSENLTAVAALDLLEQAWREQPSNSAIVRVLIYELTYRGYLLEAHQIAVQFVEIDPLSPVAIYSLGESFAALGQTGEAFAPLQLALELDNFFAQWFLPTFHLSQGRDEDAIAIYESTLRRAGASDIAWVRDLIIAGRDRATGQAYLDNRIPEIITSLPEEIALDWQNNLDLWYLQFGFLDRYYETLLAANPNKESWSLAAVYFWNGIILQRVEFTAHPKFLEVAEQIGIIDVWEQRGPPDFCEKVAGNWVCN
jgi:TolB-like protein